ncbi:MAG TPA: amidohydrolase family protein [Candidatus Sulfotelmatobacter sp.]|nr:amidohydrolase family protein [Candidatus Sulfotelmatobacter sp.]
MKTALRLALIPVIAGFCCTIVARAAEIKAIAIVHARLIDGMGGTPVENATVIVRGKTIEYAGPASGMSVPKDAQVIDAEGKSVMPGLADLHVHLQGGWDGTSVDLLGYQRYLNAMLYSGVTTLLDTGNYQPWILQLRQEQAAGRLRGPRIYCVGAMIDSADPAWPDLAYALTSRYQIPEFVSRDQAAKVDMIKGYSNLSEHMLHWLSEAAGKAGIRVVIDQWERNGSPDLVATGISGFAHLPTRKMSDEDIQFAKDHNIFFITTLVVTESFARTRLNQIAFLKEPYIADTMPPWFLAELAEYAQKPQSETEKKETEANLAAHQEAMRNVKKLHDAGFLIATGTDAPYPGVFQGEGLHHELELLVESGWKPLEAIRASTYDAARLMKAENEWGSVQAGRRATLLIIAGNPAENIHDTRKIEMVMQDGTILDRPALKYDAKTDPGYRGLPGLFNP